MTNAELNQQLIDMYNNNKSVEEIQQVADDYCLHRDLHNTCGMFDIVACEYCEVTKTLIKFGICEEVKKEENK